MDTKGSFILYPYGMATSDGLVRTVNVFDANGNAKATNTKATFEANTKYTIRIGFNSEETVQLNQIHFAPSGTFYLTASRFGNYADTDTHVYSGKTGSVHAYYDGEVTALGFAAGTKVSTVANASTWDDRVYVGGDQN